jgi:hypothetical protein
MATKPTEQTNPDPPEQSIDGMPAPLPGESSKAYFAFSIYASMLPTDQTCAATARVYDSFINPTEDPKPEGHLGCGKGVGCLRQIERWCLEFHWKARALTYNHYRIRKVSEILDSDVVKMNERHAGIGGHFQSLAMQQVEKWLEEYTDPKTGKILKRLKEGVELTASDVRLLTQAGVTIERQARGQAGQIVNANIQAAGKVADLSDALLDALTELDKIDDAGGEAIPSDTGSNGEAKA